MTTLTSLPSFGMPLGQKSPKSELHEFYQMYPGNPQFSVRAVSYPPAEPLFQCDLTCPAIGGPNGLPEQTFVGQGRNKKTAEQYAAEQALGFLRSKGLIAPAPTPMANHELPPDLQRQFAAGASSDTTSLIRLQAQKLAADQLRASLLASGSMAQPVGLSPLTPNGTNGTANGVANGSANGTASGSADGSKTPDDFDSLDKDALIIKLRQATKENELLKAQVTDEEHRRQQAIDLLLGAAVPQNGA